METEKQLGWRVTNDDKAPMWLFKVPESLQHTVLSLIEVQCVKVIV